MRTVTHSAAFTQSTSSIVRTWPLLSCCTSVPFSSGHRTLQGSTCKSHLDDIGQARLITASALSLVTGDHNNYTWRELRHIIQLFASKDLKYTPLYPLALYALSHALGGRQRKLYAGVRY